MSKYYVNDNFNLQNAYDDCKQVFEGITDEESYQKADCGVVMYYANEIMYALEKALEERPQGDLISRSEVEKLGATCLARRNENGQLEAIINLDNAPTVDTYTKDDLTREYLKGYNDCKDMNGRTTGEWIVDEFGRKICGKCQFPFAEFQSDNYCSLCGAKMQKGDAEE